MFLPAKLTEPALGFIRPPRHCEGGFSRTRRPTTAMASPAFMSDVEATQRHDVAVFGFGFVDVVEAVSMQNRIAIFTPFSTLAKSAFSARRVVTNNATTTAAKTARTPG